MHVLHECAWYCTVVPETRPAPPCESVWGHVTRECAQRMRFGLGVRDEGLAASRPGGRAARHQPRALLRPRLRVRDHAGVAPPARPPELGGRGTVDARAARRLVVVELHDVGHERARSAIDRRSPAPDRADAREPVDGDRHPGGVRRQGAAVRGLVRRDSGGAAHLPDLRRGGAPARSSAGGPGAS